MTYAELMNQSVRSYSNGAVSLIDVPNDLRISRSRLVALACDMHDRIARNNSARSSSARNAAKRSTR